MFCYVYLYYGKIHYVFTIYKYLKSRTYLKSAQPWTLVLRKWIFIECIYHNCASIWNQRNYINANTAKGQCSVHAYIQQPDCSRSHCTGLLSVLRGQRGVSIVAVISRTRSISPTLVWPSWLRVVYVGKQVCSLIHTILFAGIMNTWVIGDKHACTVECNAVWIRKKTPS